MTILTDSGETPSPPPQRTKSVNGDENLLSMTPRALSYRSEMGLITNRIDSYLLYILISKTHKRRRTDWCMVRHISNNFEDLFYAGVRPGSKLNYQTVVGGGKKISNNSNGWRTVDAFSASRKESEITLTESF